MSAPAPQPSWRKPAGALLILGMILLWAFGVAILSRWIGLMHPLAQAPVYLVLGIGWLWVLPLRRLLLWMETGRWR